MADQYITYPMVADARDLMQQVYDFMALQFPGWEPSEGQLDTTLIEGICSEAADIATLTTEVPKSIFRYFGARLMGIIPQDAVAAVATSTWYLTDNLGHIIPDGTQVTIPDATGTPVPFVTLGDVTVLAGSTATAAGGVTLIATVPGSDSSGIGSASGVVSLSDIYPWVDHIVQIAPTTGGIDAESDDDYLNRLSNELMLIAPRPILPQDFSNLARNVEGVQRATTIDGYNPSGGTYGNQRMVTVAAIDANGVAVTSGILTEVQNYLESLREINFVVNTINPTVDTVDVTCNVLLANGYSSNDVQYAVQTAIQNYLSPAQWGVDPSDDPNDPVSWNNTTTLSYLSLASAIQAVSGVALVISLSFGTHGGTLYAADYTLSGVAPLPAAGTITVSVSLPT